MIAGAGSRSSRGRRSFTRGVEVVVAFFFLMNGGRRRLLQLVQLRGLYPPPSLREGVRPPSGHCGPGLEPSVLLGAGWGGHGDLRITQAKSWVGEDTRSRDFCLQAFQRAGNEGLLLGAFCFSK